MAQQRNLTHGILMMNRVREILRLQGQQQLTQREIHRATGIARSCIQRYLQLASLHEVTYIKACSLSDEELCAALSRKVPGRRREASVAEPDYREIHREFISRKGVTLELLWVEWVNKNGSGYSYSTFCRRYAEWSRAEKVTMRHHYAPGEKMLTDYAGETLSYTDLDDIVHKVEIFVAVFGFSNKIYTEPTESQKVMDWVNSHIRAFSFFGGVSAAVVTDNLKSAVIKASRYEPELQQTFEEFGNHYNTTILPARAGKPRDKSKVEKAVQDVERWVLAPLRNHKFLSLDEIRKALGPLLDVLNQKRMQEYGISRNELFEKEEKTALRPLPGLPFVVGAWKRARVHTTDYHMQVAEHWYSVPYQQAGKEVWVKVSDKLVEIFSGSTRVASHIKSYRRYRFTTLPEHMPEHHRAFRTERSKEAFLIWARSVGPETEKQVLALFDSLKHEEQAFRSIFGLKRLAKTFGMEALEKGARRANELGVASQSFVRRCIELQPTDKNLPPVTHENIRGGGYYH